MDAERVIISISVPLNGETLKIETTPADIDLAKKVFDQFICNAQNNAALAVTPIFSLSTLSLDSNLFRRIALDDYDPSYILNLSEEELKVHTMDALPIDELISEELIVKIKDKNHKIISADRSKKPSERLKLLDINKQRYSSKKRSLKTMSDFFYHTPCAVHNIKGKARTANWATLLISQKSELGASVDIITALAESGKKDLFSKKSALERSASFNAYKKKLEFNFNLYTRVTCAGGYCLYAANFEEVLVECLQRTACLFAESSVALLMLSKGHLTGFTDESLDSLLDELKAFGIPLSTSNLNAWRIWAAKSKLSKLVKKDFFHYEKLSMQVKQVFAPIAGDVIWESDPTLCSTRIRNWFDEIIFESKGCLNAAFDNSFFEFMLGNIYSSLEGPDSIQTHGILTSDKGLVDAVSIMEHFVVKPNSSGVLQLLVAGSPSDDQKIMNKWEMLSKSLGLVQFTDNASRRRFLVELTCKSVNLLEHTLEMAKIEIKTKTTAKFKDSKSQSNVLASAQSCHDSAIRRIKNFAETLIFNINNVLPDLAIDEP